MAFLAMAILLFVAAVVVFILGVVVTSGVYGSRMAWLLGVVMPLIAGAATFAWLIIGPHDIRGPLRNSRWIGLS